MPTTENVRTRILYVLRTGCAWRMLSYDFPLGSIICQVELQWNIEMFYNRKWLHSGIGYAAPVSHVA